MATEVQYKAFKDLYDEELGRYTNLAERAKLYQGLIVVYLGAIAFKFADLQSFTRDLRIPIWMILAIGLSFLIAFFLTIWATHIRKYQEVVDPVHIIENFGPTPPSDEDFLDDFLVGLAGATNSYVKVNNRVGLILTFASYFLALGVGFQIFVFMLAIYWSRI